jgi:predicted HAD superfamily Cof-like phosphohydrolase
MNLMLRDVADFHELILNDYAEVAPSLISLEYCVERSRFLHEELDEFCVASGEGNIVGVADALADIIYVALGTAYKMGLPFEEIWRAVQDANMRKVPGQTKRGNKVDAMKPEGWVGPEAAIARAIQRKSSNG